MIKIPWDKYIQYCYKLPEKIPKKLAFSYIVAISRGGLIPGTILSYELNLPLAVLSAKSYTDYNKRVKVKYNIEYSMVHSRPMESALVVDDINDTGSTFDTLIPHIKMHFPKFVKTAVLIEKEGTKSPADYKLFTVKQKWVHFPYEKRKSLHSKPRIILKEKQSTKKKKKKNWHERKAQQRRLEKLKKLGLAEKVKKL